MKTFILTLALVISGRMAFAQSEGDFKTIRQWQFGAGPALVTGLNTSDLVTGWRFGFGLQMDPRYDIQIISTWAFSNTNTDMHDFNVSVASNYYLKEGRNVPFVTGDIGYGWVHAHTDCANYTCEDPADDANGMVLGAGAGYKFFRGSPVNLSALAHYNVMMATTRRGTPSEASLQLILLY